MDLEPSSTLLTKLFVADDFFLTCNRVSCVYTLEIEKIFDQSLIHEMQNFNNKLELLKQ